MEERDDAAMPTEDPRETGSTGAGYAEESPEEVTGGDGDGDGEPPERDAEEPDAPGVSSPEEGDPGQATGNPGAAG